MRYIFVTPDSVVDSKTGALLDKNELEVILRSKPGGVIVGNNLYGWGAEWIAPMVDRDKGWTLKIVPQKKRKLATDRIGGLIYYSSLTYREPKESQRINGKRTYSRGSVKWVWLNIELFCETKEIEQAAKALVALAEARGISTRFSPGTFGAGMLRASPHWTKDRRPAPHFISDLARIHLPGNYYALRDNYQNKVIPSAYYLDQKSSHHTISSTIQLPNPGYLRARGFPREVKEGNFPPWIQNLDILKDEVGLICATIECDFIPSTLKHLYPPWARKIGKHVVWIWTPDLRLFDHRVRLRWISASFTSYRPDPVLFEYANWALQRLAQNPHSAVKPALLAAYGLLASKRNDGIESYTYTSREKPGRATLSRFPLLGDVYRSNIKSKRVPSIQNVVARGVIESETRARSLEYAKSLEAEGVKVSQIYADGLIAVTEQMPLFLPDGWRIAGGLSNVRSPSPTFIEADEMIRLPGVPSGRRSAYIEHSSRSLDKVGEMPDTVYSQ